MNKLRCTKNKIQSKILVLRNFKLYLVTNTEILVPDFQWNYKQTPNTLHYTEERGAFTYDIPPNLSIGIWKEAHAVPNKPRGSITC
jgi:hypothetical protein